MARVLVTGATGFVGRHVIAALKADHEVVAAVRQKQTHLDCEQIVVGEIHGKTDWSAALNHIDIVIHLAARVHVMQDLSPNPLDAFTRTNTLGTQQFAEQAAAHGVKRFIFLSTIKVNGEETELNQAFRDSSQPRPSDAYALSKWRAEQALQAVSKQTNMEIVILRPPLVYGPGVKANFYRLIEWANRSWPLPFGSVKNQRSFIYIDNLVSAIMAVLDDPRAKNHTFLIADDESWSLTELFRELRMALQRPDRLWPIPGNWVSNALRAVGLSSFAQRLFGSLQVSNEGIKSTLNWQPPHSAQEGLRLTVNWYQDANQ